MGKFLINGGNLGRRIETWRKIILASQVVFLYIGILFNYSIGLEVQDSMVW
jgi:hypothetical protein